MLRAPADATVARLIGFENVLDVAVDDTGVVRVAGVDLLRDPTAAAGKARLAVWAAGLTVSSVQIPSAALRVASVRQGPGRWELRLDAAVATSGQRAAMYPST